MLVSFGQHRNQFPPISSTRSSSSITPAATIASTSATVKRRRGNPSAAGVTRATDPIAKNLLAVGRSRSVYHKQGPSSPPPPLPRPPASERARRALPAPLKEHYDSRTARFNQAAQKIGEDSNEGLGAWTRRAWICSGGRSSRSGRSNQNRHGHSRFDRERILAARQEGL